MAPPLLAPGPDNLSPPLVTPAPGEVQRYLRRAQSKASALLRAAGVDLGAQTVSARATVDPAGNVTAVQILRSSGLAHIDDAVEAALRKVIGRGAAPGLLSGSVTMRLGPSPVSRSA